MTIDLYRTQAERDRETLERAAESEARRQKAADDYHRAVRNLVIAVFVLIFASVVFWWTPKAAGADASYQAYTLEQVAR